jgi:hypothetical protein
VAITNGNFVQNRTSSAGNLIFHLEDKVHLNEEITVTNSSRFDIQEMFLDAKNAEVKNAVFHMQFSPALNQSSDKYDIFEEFLKEEYQLDDYDFYSVEHAKLRQHTDTGLGADTHRHYVFGVVNEATGKNRDFSFYKIRNEKLSRKFELAAGEPLTNGSHDDKTFEFIMKDEAFLNKYGANVVARADEIRDLLLKEEKPQSSYNKQARINAENVGLSLSKMKEEMKHLSLDEAAQYFRFISEAHGLQIQIGKDPAKLNPNGNSKRKGRQNNQAYLVDGNGNIISSLSRISGHSRVKGNEWSELIGSANIDNYITPEFEAQEPELNEKQINARKRRQKRVNDTLKRLDAFVANYTGDITDDSELSRDATNSRRNARDDIKFGKHGDADGGTGDSEGANEADGQDAPKPDFKSRKHDEHLESDSVEFDGYAETRDGRAGLELTGDGGRDAGSRRKDDERRSIDARQSQGLDRTPATTEFEDFQFGRKDRKTLLDNGGRSRGNRGLDDRVIDAVGRKIDEIEFTDLARWGTHMSGSALALGITTAIVGVVMKMIFPNSPLANQLLGIGQQLTMGFELPSDDKISANLHRLSDKALNTRRVKQVRLNPKLKEKRRSLHITRTPLENQLYVKQRYAAIDRLQLDDIDVKRDNKLALEVKAELAREKEAYDTLIKSLAAKVARDGFEHNDGMKAVENEVLKFHDDSSLINQISSELLVEYNRAVLKEKDALLRKSASLDIDSYFKTKAVLNKSIVSMLEAEADNIELDDDIDRVAGDKQKPHLKMQKALEKLIEELPELKTIIDEAKSRDRKLPIITIPVLRNDDTEAMKLLMKKAMNTSQAEYSKEDIQKLDDAKSIDEVIEMLIKLKIGTNAVKHVLSKQDKVFESLKNKEMLERLIERVKEFEAKKQHAAAPRQAKVKKAGAKVVTANVLLKSLKKRYIRQYKTTLRGLDEKQITEKAKVNLRQKIKSSNPNLSEQQIKRKVNQGLAKEKNVLLSSQKSEIIHNQKLDRKLKEIIRMTDKKSDVIERIEDVLKDKKGNAKIDDIHDLLDEMKRRDLDIEKQDKEKLEKLLKEIEETRERLIEEARREAEEAAKNNASYKPR